MKKDALIWRSWTIQRPKDFHCEKFKAEAIFPGIAEADVAETLARTCRDREMVDDFTPMLRHFWRSMKDLP